jgi:hypothetical protein
MFESKTTFCTLLFLLIFAILPGCATEYQARGFLGDGYTDVRISENTYKVDFQCNDSTSETLCEGFLFRRCAELTLNAGYDYFVMENHSTTIKQDDVVVPGHYNTVTTGKGNDKTTTHVFQPGYVVANRYPVSRATIMMFKGTIPKEAKNAYNPRDILKYLSAGR